MALRKEIKIIRALAAGVLFVSATLSAEVVPAISKDPPSAAAPAASFVEITVPSHSEQLLGVFYLAAGPGPHPAAVIFHGFPGYEQNLDLAQALRRAGYNVLAVHYRGSWGVKGSFSFQHAIEDADATRVIEAVRAMGLDHFPNTSYPRGLKHLLGMSL